MSRCINPSLIRQYLYCPAAAYYIITGAGEPPTERMKKGKENQTEAVEAAAKALGATKVEHSPRLEGHGICGVVDAVLWINGRPAPLEVKYAKPPRRVPTSHKAQAAAYALAAQGTYRKAATTAYIYYAEAGQIHTVALTQDLKNLVLHTAKQIEKIYKGWTPHPQQHPTKCQGCWYRKYCGYTDTKVETI
ncbi:MAG: CRISPR-associated protein Cas4 [Pyrobaculum sp.]